MNKIEDYSFPKNDFLFYFKGLYKDRGVKAFYQFMNRPHRRPKTRQLIERFAPEGFGLEIGVGARTVCPVPRTVLSDGYHSHGVQDSIAQVFFRADQIPYADQTFSFVLSEHTLEHITNPIKSLKEWQRVLKPKGKVFLVLPHHERGQDCYRQRTTLQHLIEDYENNVPDDDRTHLEEYIQNVYEKGLHPGHYAHMDPEGWLKTGSVHHHVWAAEDIVELCTHLGMTVVHTEDKLYDRRDSFVVIAEV